MTERDFRDYIPFTAVKDGCVLSKRGDLTFGWEIALPTAFTVNEAGYDSIIFSFIQAYRLLPPWCIVHKQDVYCVDRYVPKEAGSFLGEAYQKHFSGRPYLEGRTYIYLTFSMKTNIKNSNSSSAFLGTSDKKLLSRERIEECAGIASQFAALLKNNGLLGIRQMTTEDFIRSDELGRDRGVIPDFIKMYDQSGPDYNIQFRPNEIVYGDNVLKAWYVEDSSAYEGTVSSVVPIHEMSSGSSKVFLSGGSPIGYNLRKPHVVNRYVVTLPKGEVESELDQRKRLMSSMSLYSSACAIHSEELRQYLLEAARDGTTTVKCFMSLLAWGPREDIPEIRNSIVSAFSEMRVSVVEETRITPLLHYASIPANAADLGYDNFLNSELTAFLCNGLWDGYDKGIPGGLIHVCDRRTMVPMTIDIQSYARELGKINNMNAVVVGPSGSGKSFTMNSLVQDFYDAGEHTVIIDVGDSYQGQCEVIRELSGGKDGVYNTYDPENPFGFNPFFGRADWNRVDEEGESASSGQDFILSLFKTIYKPEKGWQSAGSSVLRHLLDEFLTWWDGGAPDSAREAMRDAVVNEKRARAEKNKKKFDEKKALSGWMNPVDEIFFEGRPADPVFDDFYQYVVRIVSPLVRDENYFLDHVPVKADMLDVDQFGAAMAMYAKGGQYGFLLNATEQKDLFSSRLTVFEVDKIKNNADLFPLWVLCIMHSFEEKMRSLPCQKVLIIEEAWKAVATETMKDFIIWMWRTARKFKTSAVVVTQDIADLTGSEVIKSAIINNSDVKILLDQRANANSFDRYVDVLGLTPMAKNLVLSVNRDLLPGYRYKEAYIGIGQDYCNVFAIEVSPQQAMVFESDKTRKRPLFDLAKRTGSFVGAVKQLTGMNED